jgi:hypothetical protein
MSITIPLWDEAVSLAARSQVSLVEAVYSMSSSINGSKDSSYCAEVLNNQYLEIITQLKTEIGLTTDDKATSMELLPNLRGLLTCVFRINRLEPLETIAIKFKEMEFQVPTTDEILRIKAILILKRNLIRDYVDFAILAKQMGEVQVANALSRYDVFYPHESGQSYLQQLLVQIANPAVDDAEESLSNNDVDVQLFFLDFQALFDYLKSVALKVFRLICIL